VKKEKTLGFRINYTVINPYTLEAGVFIDFGSKTEKDFLCNAEIKKAIDNLMNRSFFRPKIGGRIGNLRLTLNSKTGKAKWDALHPLKFSVKTLSGKGIAGKIEDMFLEEFERRIIEPKEIMHISYSFRRWRQLKKRGTGSKIPFVPFSVP